jgi:hypothetical protein
MIEKLKGRGAAFGVKVVARISGDEVEAFELFATNAYF